MDIVLNSSRSAKNASLSAGVSLAKTIFTSWYRALLEGCMWVPRYLRA